MSRESTPQDTACEHLRIIRTLMERGHIYRAVSAPAAFTGGVLALGLAAYGMQDFRPGVGPSGNGLSSREFFLAWLAVLFLSTLVNLLLLMRESKGKGQPFITEGMRMALRASVPPMLTGGILGACLILFKEHLELAALVWILSYGLALQSTLSFAPKSIIHLARAFLVGGQLLAILWFVRGDLAVFQNSAATASMFLGLTFGFFHVIYAVVVFVNRPPTALDLS